jgi:hypothetical protein
MSHRAGHFLCEMGNNEPGRTGSPLTGQIEGARWPALRFVAAALVNPYSELECAVIAPELATHPFGRGSRPFSGEPRKHLSHCRCRRGSGADLDWQ